mmetsp:Transcript_10943/g.30023  ORF Transcript_10943/g.30023 Transcript_10943/m.30023 type:complete len:223 (-) Transcript_10943:2342-3010(-)
MPCLINQSRIALGSLGSPSLCTPRPVITRTSLRPGRMAAASMLRCSMGSASSTCRQWKSHSKRLKRDALRQACNFSAARVDAAQHLAFRFSTCCHISSALCIWPLRSARCAAACALRRRACRRSASARCTRYITTVLACRSSLLGVAPLASMATHSRSNAASKSASASSAAQRSPRLLPSPSELQSSLPATAEPLCCCCAAAHVLCLAAAAARPWGAAAEAA